MTYEEQTEEAPPPSTSSETADRDGSDEGGEIDIQVTFLCRLKTIRLVLTVYFYFV